MLSLMGEQTRQRLSKKYSLKEKKFTNSLANWDRFLSTYTETDGGLRVRHAEICF